MRRGNTRTLLHATTRAAAVPKGCRHRYIGCLIPTAWKTKRSASWTVFLCVLRVNKSVYLVDMDAHHGMANGSREPLLPTEGFTLKDAPIENLRPLRVVVIGAGFSGTLAAIRIPERLRNVELVVYEKNEDVGGVW
jgi:hypothetical protein